MDEQRIIALEERLAHQDQVIEDLNTVISDQWREIERLKRQMQMIDDQIAAVEHMARSGKAEPPPPHY